MSMTYAPWSPHAHAPNAAARVVVWLSAKWVAYRHWRARRASIAVLQGLDDRTLHDLGLSRSEVESVVYDTAGEHLRRYDANWASPPRR